MGRLTLRLPRLGETMEEARVTDWLVTPGTAFRRGDVLLEVETDKTVVEVPALADGTLLAQLVQPGDVVALDQPIAEVEAEGVADSPPAAAPTVAPTAEPEPVAPAAPTDALADIPARLAASPAARAAARRAGVDLARIVGSGRRGRVTAADVAGSAQDPAGVAIHHLAGKDTPIVLLHGLFDDHRGWRDLPHRLGAAGHAVLSVDLPGHGASSAAPSLSAALDAVAAAISQAVPQGPLRLFGHSLGAIFATRLALRLGDRVERVVLSAPAGLGARINGDFTDGMLAAETPAALSRALDLLDAGPISATAAAQELQRLKALRPGHAALAAELATHGFQQVDIRAELARLTCDLRVIFGTADRILDWRDVEHLPARAAVHLVRGAGHLPHLAAAELSLSLTSAPSERRLPIRL